MPRRRRHRWLAMLLVLSACEPAAPRPPAGFDGPDARARGRALFVAHCAICHGERADGQGPRRGSLAPPPANFRDPSWPARTRPGRVYGIVRDGVRGTPMAGWKAVLDEAQTWDVVGYLLGVAEEGAP